MALRRCLAINLFPSEKKTFLYLYSFNIVGIMIINYVHLFQKYIKTINPIPFHGMQICSWDHIFTSLQYRQQRSRVVARDGRGLLTGNAFLGEVVLQN